MTTEVAVGDPELALEVGEIGARDARECGQDPEPHPLMHVVVEVVDRMLGHVRPLYSDSLEPHHKSVP